VTIQASESVKLDGLEKTAASFFGPGKRGNLVLSTSIRSEVEGAEATGRGGTIKIGTPLIVVSDGAFLSSGTSGQGNAGNIEITAKVAAFTGVGVSSIPNGVPETTTKLDFSSGAFSTATGTGKGGSIILRMSESLMIQQGAQLSVSGTSKSGAGNLEVYTNQLQLRQGNLRAESAAGSKGNIRIDSAVLLMRQGSRITTSATDNANGGNITISSPIMIGLENSDIIANAKQGVGGNIGITTQSLVGLQYRDRATAENDISASSELGINGTVQVNMVGADLNSSLVQLPVELVDPSTQIANRCKSNRDSRFIISGRGGMPENPIQQTSYSDRTWRDLRPLSDFRQSNRLQSAPVLIEATKLERNANGTIQLIAEQVDCNT
jgi:large exoprotein involved in heme utilization and adhesion